MRPPHGTGRSLTPMEQLPLKPTCRSQNGTGTGQQLLTSTLVLTQAILITITSAHGLETRPSTLQSGTVFGLRHATRTLPLATGPTSAARLPAMATQVQAAEQVWRKVDNWLHLAPVTGLRFLQPNRGLNGPTNIRFPDKMNTTFESSQIRGVLTETTIQTEPLPNSQTDSLTKMASLLSLPHRIPVATELNVLVA